jgi:hypothetical protein
VRKGKQLGKLNICRIVTNFGLTLSNKEIAP